MKKVIGAVALASLAIIPRAVETAATAPTIEAFLSPAYPQDLVAAKKADRIAWWSYERGQRNVYTAAAPDFRPVALTRFADDNGVEIGDLQVSDDGTVVSFVRGTQPNREGWVANPTSDARGADRTVWAAMTTGGPAWKIGEGTTPALAPDGRSVVFAKEGQIYQYLVRRPASGAAVASSAAGRPSDGRMLALIRAWGTNGSPVWSPDGTRVAFVSNRVDHSFIGIYDVRTKTLKFLSPSVDHDTSPTWSPDGRHVAFIRRPGTPFGQQAHQGSGGIGNPDGPAYNPMTALRNGGRGQGGRGANPQPGGRGAAGSGAERPGLMSAAFAGGYTLSFWVADATDGSAHEFWHNQSSDQQWNTINQITWADAEHVIFQAEPEEWIRYFAVRVGGLPTDAPRALTPGNGMVENANLSSDGKFLFYTTNAGDIEHRHIWKAPIAEDRGAGAPGQVSQESRAEQLTRGDTIETYPAPLASGSHVAVLSADARRPQSVGVVPAGGGAPRIIYPTLPKNFPTEEHVVPQTVLTKAADGMESHNQLFLPKDLKPGEKRPAIVFVHGGPVRQMLPGYHYMHFYHIAYAVNQWLTSKGYVVLSVNYRSGIGYGKSFRTAPNSGGRGNAEYKDVLAGGKYLQTRADVDPDRIGIWGLSYGGVLTAQALARNSDIFKAGVDMAGVHLWGSSLDPDNASYQASAISAIDTWKSPVLLVHGDDDRNVQFSQTTGLVQLLRAHNVPHELIVYPDDTHEPLLHQRYLYGFNRLAEFLGRYLKPPSATTTAGPPG